MEGSMILFYSSKFAWARGSVSKCIHNLGTRLQNFSPVLS